MTIKEVCELAKQTALAYSGHVPMLIVNGSKSSAICQLESLPDTHEAKAQRMAMTGFSLARKNEIGLPKQVFLVTEGWMSTAKDGKIPQIRPSQDPNRKEVLLVNSLNVQPRQLDGVVFEILRDRKAKIVELKELQLHPKESEKGEPLKMESPLLDAFVFGFGKGLNG